ncbi:hypothetical protein SeMB42_g02736 [Synchytrium endobioticum]|uniref:LIM zinc-binding domain-containing protein n=1 Tax=Synchytrium endobioticum TaxID=286115 RepID=A0A507CV77_9FUNG|nr:hypothetical protein SeLEV6574_g05252 [Synchytrium endobioticum]TPX49109.1 hypothetical protein SeMB42_g02736 [Synchytrium endobioticum]
MDGGTCTICKEEFRGPHVVANNNEYHNDCFLCQQCLLPFSNGVYFQAEGRLLCGDDYAVLFGSRCGRCGEIITGNAIHALDMKWHPEHFICQSCGKSLAGMSFLKKNGKPVCKSCYAKLNAAEVKFQNLCGRCKKPITGVALVLQGERFHAYHFTCVRCKQELSSENCTENEGKLYCNLCYDGLASKMCHACRGPIHGRCITTFGRNFHPEHFVCTKCEGPFPSSQYWEYGNKPYCETHYHEMIGAICALCREAKDGQLVEALGRKWCEDHLLCMGCHVSLTSGKIKFVEWDGQPFCKRCFEKLPSNTKKNVVHYAEMERRAEYY